MARRLPVFLRSREQESLIAAAETERDRMLLRTGLYLGLRVSEIVCLRVEHVDLDEGSVLVYQGKGSKDRYVPVPSRFLPDLRAWIGARLSGYLFPAERRGRKGRGHLSQRSVQLMVRACAERAAIAKQVTPHKLRHSYATTLVGRGASVLDVQQLLGHSKLATTEIYLHTDTSRLRGAVDRL